jgi:hypothetical protein
MQMSSEAVPNGGITPSLRWASSCDEDAAGRLPRLRAPLRGLSREVLEPSQIIPTGSALGIEGDARAPYSFAFAVAPGPQGLVEYIT